MSDRRDRNRRIKRLQETIPLVATCTAREVVRVDLLGTKVDVREGVILIREGRPGTECFVVLEGIAEVRRGGETLEFVGPGSVLGEIALLHGTARTATVIAATPMRLLVFTRSEFEQLSRIAPSIEAGLRRIAADRRAANSVASLANDSRFAISGRLQEACGDPTRRVGDPTSPFVGSP